MSNETTENFLKVMATFEWPEIKPASYRLYYNDDGTPKCYSMDELPGKYVEIDAETFARRPWNVRVVDQRIELIQPAILVKKLQPNQSTGTCCHVQDVCVVVPESKPHTIWNTITHEIS